MCGESFVGSLSPCGGSCRDRGNPGTPVIAREVHGIRLNILGAMLVRCGWFGYVFTPDVLCILGAEQLLSLLFRAFRLGVGIADCYVDERILNMA